MTSFATLVDRLVEAPVVSSFTNVGYQVRKRVDDWQDLDEISLVGKTMVITGATSGLGLAAARQFARCGASLLLVGRNPDKTQRVVNELIDETGNDKISPVIADMSDLDAVGAACDVIMANVDRLEVLIHNAGALSAERKVTDAGLEVTVASQVVGPHLMTTRLLPALRAGAPGRVLTMSSGGMYSAPLSIKGLQMGEGDYRGADQYARAKRAQVTLNEMWADKVSAHDVVFHALHPGWADTPGVEEALPTFRRIVGPLLRSPEQGADTLVWLAAADGPPVETTGGFWLDRRPRSLHKLPTTRRTDTPERRAELWDWVEAAAGLA